MPFEFLNENLAARLMTRARKTILTPDFFQEHFTDDCETCCYLLAVMCLLENCACTMLPICNPRFARFDYSGQLRGNMLACADGFEISAPLEKVALQEPERDYLLDLAIRTRKDGKFTYNDVFAVPRPFPDIFRLLQECRGAQFGRMLERFHGGGFRAPNAVLHTMMVIAPIWFFGQGNVNSKQEIFVKQVVPYVFSNVECECNKTLL